MDYLPFIDDDESGKRFKDTVESLITKELRPENDIHPEVATLQIHLRKNPLEDVPSEELPRIDLTRYAVNDGTDTETLCTIDSYLRHQELTLQKLLPETLLNQWAINNDYLTASEEALQRTITNQEDQIQSLNQYRARMQSRDAPAFKRYEQEWKAALIKRLDSLD